MSAAVNDRPHTAYSAVAHLPLTGELHPLRRDFERWLLTGNAITITVSLIVFASIYFWPRPAEVKLPIEFVGGPGIYPSPPPIDPNSGKGPGVPAVAPDIAKAIPDPVDDEELKSDDGLVDSPSGNGEPGDVPGHDGVDGPGKVDFLDPPAPPAQSPPVDWWDEAPVLLSIQPPVYPEMVRDAGIDGSVMVRVLIGANGKVKKAYVVEGSDPLHESALESARTAVFKPALQGTHPVEVWVVIPITFELRDRH